MTSLRTITAGRRAASRSVRSRAAPAAMLLAVTAFAAVGAFAGDDVPGGQAPLSVSKDFPSGSGDVQTIDQQQRLIRMRPSEYQDRGWACWWYVQVQGITPGETIRLDIGRGPWATPTHAAFSLDNQSWQQTAAGRRSGDRMEYRQRIDANTAWFAWGPPFTVADADQLVAWAGEQMPGSRAFELCRTRRGRPVPALQLSPRDGSGGDYGIWIQARQHAWEAGSSWVCRGLVEWLCSTDPRATSLRSAAEVTIVPIMDVDNVLLGAGGKNQTPHDHNRDWSDEPYWPEVRAAMQQIRRLDHQQRFDLFVDLHNPGPGTRQPFYYIAPRGLLSELGQRNLDRFLAASRIEMTGPLNYAGETRESGPAYDRQWRKISKNWVSLNARGHVVAVTLETAWNSRHSTAANYRTLGEQLGRAIERYLRTRPRLSE